MTPQQFLEKYGSDNRYQAIIKTVPPGPGGRELLFGFERNKRSRKYRVKHLLPSPIDMAQLAKGPIKATAENIK